MPRQGVPLGKAGWLKCGSISRIRSPNGRDVNPPPFTLSRSPHFQIQGTAGIIVDLAAVKSILEAKLPGVLAGKAVSELAEPWPEAV